MPIKNIIVIDDKGNHTALIPEDTLALMEITDVNRTSKTMTLEEVDPPEDGESVSMIWEYNMDVQSIIDKKGQRFHMIVWAAEDA